MQKSAAVTASAALALVGSIVTLLMGIVGAVAIPITARRATGLPMASSSIVALMEAVIVCVYFMPSIWGIVTAIGLFRARDWARISILIFAGLLTFIGCLTGIMVLFAARFAPASAAMPPPPPAVLAIMSVLFFTCAAIGIWWLVLFNRSAVKLQFQQPSTGADSSAAKISRT